MSELVKIDHEVVAAEDELERFWSSAIFQGSPDKIVYDGHSLLVVLLTSTLPLLVFRGVLSLRAEKIRFWRLENEDARVKTPFVWWRHRPTVKSVRFLPLILHQSVHLRCRKVREHGEWFYIKLQTHLQSLRERTPFLFAISKKHSGRFNTEFSLLFPLFRIRTVLSYPCMD